MLTALRRRLAAEDGISLVEMMVSMVVLAVVFAALAANSMTALAAARRGQDQIAATQLANQVAESLMAAPWLTIAPPAVPPTQPPVARAGLTFTPTATVSWVDDPCNGSASVAAQQDYLRFDVGVAWTTADGRPHTLAISQFRTPLYAEKQPSRVDVASC